MLSGDYIHTLAADSAHLYELIHRGNAGDVEFYAHACRGHLSILELGCGTGRIAREIAGEARRYVGIDIDPAMVQRLRDNLAAEDLSQGDRVHLMTGDMASFELPERFERIVVPYNGLFCLKSDAEVTACFERIHAHLSDSGLAVFDVYHVDDEIQAELEETACDTDEPVSTEPEPLVRIDREGTTVLVSEAYDWYPSARRAVAHYHFRIMSEDDRVETRQRIDHHYLTEEQLVDSLESAGLKIIERRLGFTDADAPDLEQLIFIVSK